MALATVLASAGCAAQDEPAASSDAAFNARDLLDQLDEGILVLDNVPATPPPAPRRGIATWSAYYARAKPLGVSLVDTDAFDGVILLGKAKDGAIEYVIPMSRAGTGLIIARDVRLPSNEMLAWLTGERERLASIPIADPAPTRDPHTALVASCVRQVLVGTLLLAVSFYSVPLGFGLSLLTLPVLAAVELREGRMPTDLLVSLGEPGIPVLLKGVGRIATRIVKNVSQSQVTSRLSVVGTVGAGAAAAAYAASSDAPFAEALSMVLPETCREAGLIPGLAEASPTR
jgi:hypothetical protein